MHPFFWNMCDVALNMPPLPPSLPPFLTIGKNPHLFNRDNPLPLLYYYISHKKSVQKNNVVLALCQPSQTCSSRGLPRCSSGACVRGDVVPNIPGKDVSLIFRILLLVCRIRSQHSAFDHDVINSTFDQ